MADDLPPIVPMSDSSVVPPELLGQLQHSAQWAATFSPSDTNVVQRARHNEDITNYANALTAQRQAAQQNLIQTDQTAQNFYFKSLQLDMQQKEAQMRMQHANEMAPLNIASKQAQIEADQALEKARTNADLLKARHDSISAADTTGLSQHMSEILDRAQPGSEDYNAGVLRGVIEFPNADKTLQANLLKNAGVQMSPEEFIAQGMKAKQDAAAAGMANPRITSFRDKPVIVEGSTAQGSSPKLPAPLIQAAAKVDELQQRATETKRYLDAPETTNKKGLQSSLDKINADLEKATIRHDALKEAYGTSAPAPTTAKLKPLPDDVKASAAAAITSGKDPDAVRKRLQENGFDASGL